MRRDMAKLIVQGHGRKGDRSNSSKLRERDFENAPERARMREGYGWREHGRDNLSPIYNYLRDNVGRPWNDIYSEICAVADYRSSNGRHLRECIDYMVISEAELLVRLGRRWGGHYWEFYEDSNGILRRYDNKARYRYRPQHDPDNCVIDGKPYTRINDCWFEGCYKQIMETYRAWNFVKGDWSNFVREKTIVTSVRQLNKKELKQLGLSNAPDWKWYDKSK